MFYSRITASERRTIERMWRDGATIKKISEVVGVTASALYRELKRGYDGTALGYGRSGYSAEIANKDAERCMNLALEARRRPRRRRKRPEAQQTAPQASGAEQKR